MRSIWATKQKALQKLVCALITRQQFLGFLSGYQNLCHAVETPIEDRSSGDAIFQKRRGFCRSEIRYFWGLVLAMDTSIIKQITWVMFDRVLMWDEMGSPDRVIDNGKRRSIMDDNTSPSMVFQYASDRFLVYYYSNICSFLLTQKPCITHPDFSPDR